MLPFFHKSQTINLGRPIVCQPTLMGKNFKQTDPFWRIHFIYHQYINTNKLPFPQPSNIRHSLLFNHLFAIEQFSPIKKYIWILFCRFLYPVFSFTVWRACNKTNVYNTYHIHIQFTLFWFCISPIRHSHATPPAGNATNVAKIYCKRKWNKVV